MQKGQRKLKNGKGISFQSDLNTDEKLSTSRLAKCYLGCPQFKMCTAVHSILGKTLYIDLQYDWPKFISCHYWMTKFKFGFWVLYNFRMTQKLVFRPSWTSTVCLIVLTELVICMLVFLLAYTNNVTLNLSSQNNFNVFLWFWVWFWGKRRRGFWGWEVRGQEQKSSCKTKSKGKKPGHIWPFSWGFYEKDYWCAWK